MSKGFFGKNFKHSVKVTNRFDPELILSDLCHEQNEYVERIYFSPLSHDTCHVSRYVYSMIEYLLNCL